MFKGHFLNELHVSFKVFQYILKSLFKFKTNSIVMPKTNKDKEKPGQILIWQQIAKLKNLNYFNKI